MGGSQCLVLVACLLMLTHVVEGTNDIKGGDLFMALKTELIDPIAFRLERMVDSFEELESNVRQNTEETNLRLARMVDTFEELKSEVMELQNVNITSQMDEVKSHVDAGIGELWARLNVAGCCGTDCSKANVSGVYNIGKDLKAYCQVDSTGKWTVIQRRQDGSVNFTRNWANYSTGFGDVAKEHWLGNDYIHALTAAGWNRARIDLEDWNNVTYTVYYHLFSLARGVDKYRLTLSGCSTTIKSTTPGDALTDYHNGMKFSTYDQDNDISGGLNCANLGRGGWWFSKCATSNLNGDYKQPLGAGLVWGGLTGCCRSLKKTTMMLSK